MSFDSLHAIPHPALEPPQSVSPARIRPSRALTAWYTARGRRYCARPARTVPRVSACLPRFPPRLRTFSLPRPQRFCRFRLRRSSPTSRISRSMSARRRRDDRAAAASAPLDSQTIQVLHLVNGEHYSGAERVQDLLARQLPRFGCEVGFACVKPRRFPEARQSKHAPLVKMPMRGRFDLRVVKHIVELVRSEGYDLIHAHTPRTALVGRHGRRPRRRAVCVPRSQPGRPRFDCAACSTRSTRSSSGPRCAMPTGSSPFRPACAST